MSDTSLFSIPIILGSAGLLLATSSPADAQPAEVTSPAGVVESAQPADRMFPEWLQIRAEFRERMESVSSVAFTDGRDDTFWLSRLRVNTSITPTAWAGFHLQLQDARVARKDLGSGGAPFSAPLDVRLAHVDIGSGNARLSTRIGRQELVFGEQRLVGHVSWANAARSFDAARLTLRAPSLRVDAFASSVVRIDVDGWDRSGYGGRFHGVFASTTAVFPGGTVEPYFFWRSNRDQAMETGGRGDLTSGTTGVRATGPLPGGFDINLETVVQRGSVGSESSQAWAQHVRLRTPVLRTLRLLGEYNYASGDADPGDGRRGTFDPLYPTAHDKYGLADQVGWRNIHHVRVATEIAALRGVPVTAAFHTWWLASRTDGLYSAAGALLARLPDGAESRHVGHEFDIQASRALTPDLLLAGGVALLRPGAFLRAASPGGTFHSKFLMLTYVFQGDR